MLEWDKHSKGPNYSIGTAAQRQPYALAWGVNYYIETD